MDELIAPSVIAAVIAAIVGIVTARSARKSNEYGSRADLETEAFERAKSFYNDIIDRQDGEIHELEGEVEKLKARVAAQDSTITAQGIEISELREELNVARRALRIRFPDE